MANWSSTYLVQFCWCRYDDVACQEGGLRMPGPGYKNTLPTAFVGPDPSWGTGKFATTVVHECAWRPVMLYFQEVVIALSIKANKGVGGGACGGRHMHARHPIFTLSLSTAFAEEEQHTGCMCHTVNR